MNQKLKSEIVSAIFGTLAVSMLSVCIYLMLYDMGQPTHKMKIGKGTAYGSR